MTRPEQSKHDAPVPPQQYHFPAWCSAHASAISRFGVVDAEAGAGVSAASAQIMSAPASAARLALIRPPRARHPPPAPPPAPPSDHDPTSAFHPHTPPT